VRCVSNALCYELFTRCEESYQLWCLIVCDPETSERGSLDPTWDAVPRKDCCTSDNFTFSLQFITEFFSFTYCVVLNDWVTETRTGGMKLIVG
jgi:hypothetical protein